MTTVNMDTRCFTEEGLLLAEERDALRAQVAAARAEAAVAKSEVKRLAFKFYLSDKDDHSLDSLANKTYRDGLYTCNAKDMYHDLQATIGAEHFHAWDLKSPALFCYVLHDEDRRALVHDLKKIWLDAFAPIISSRKCGLRSQVYQDRIGNFEEACHLEHEHQTLCDELMRIFNQKLFEKVEQRVGRFILS